MYRQALEHLVSQESTAPSWLGCGFDAARFSEAAQDRFVETRDQRYRDIQLFIVPSFRDRLVKWWGEFHAVCSNGIRESFEYSDVKIHSTVLCPELSRKGVKLVQDGLRLAARPEGQDADSRLFRQFASLTEARRMNVRSFGARIGSSVTVDLSESAVIYGIPVPGRVANSLRCPEGIAYPEAARQILQFLRWGLPIEFACQWERLRYGAACLRLGACPRAFLPLGDTASFCISEGALGNCPTGPMVILCGGDPCDISEAAAARFDVCRCCWEVSRGTEDVVPVPEELEDFHSCSIRSCVALAEELSRPRTVKEAAQAILSVVGAVKEKKRHALMRAIAFLGAPSIDMAIRQVFPEADSWRPC